MNFSMDLQESNYFLETMSSISLWTGTNSLLNIEISSRDGIKFREFPLIFYKILNINYYIDFAYLLFITIRASCRGTGPAQHSCQPSNILLSSSFLVHQSET